MGSPWLAGSPHKRVMDVAAGEEEIYATGAGGAAGVVTVEMDDQGPTPALLLHDTLQTKINLLLLFMCAMFWNELKKLLCLGII